MRVVFLSPRYPLEMWQFTRGLAEVGAEVLGVGGGSLRANLRREGGGGLSRLTS
jgi:hypothetical protein